MKFFRVGEMGIGEMGQIIGETGVGEMEVGETEVIHTAAPWLDSIKFYMWDPVYENKPSRTSALP